MLLTGSVIQELVAGEERYHHRGAVPRVGEGPLLHVASCWDCTDATP